MRMTGVRPGDVSATLGESMRPAWQLSLAAASADERAAYSRFSKSPNLLGCESREASPRNWHSVFRSLAAPAEARQPLIDMQNAPVNWYEGLFLRPHDFQAADRYWAEA